MSNANDLNEDLSNLDDSGYCESNFNVNYGQSAS